MNTLTRTACLLAASLAAVSAHAQQDLAISTESPAGLNDVNFEDDALVGYNPATDLAVLLFDLEDSFGIVRDIKAAHLLPSGNLVISTNSGESIGGVVFTESDLIELDPVAGTASMFLDASAIGLVGVGGSVPNTNAVHVLPDGTVLLSVLNDSTLLGETYNNADVIAYDPVAGTASLFFDGALIGGDDPTLTGFAVLDDGTYALSAFSGIDGLTLGGASFTRDDIVLYDPNTGDASVYLTGLDEFDSPGEIIDAITPAVIPEPASLALLALGGLLVTRRR